MRKIFLMLGVSLFSLEANSATQECVDAPDCTELGYTQTEADCPNGAVKCPWNTGLVFCGCGEDYQYSCNDANEIAGNSKCGDYYTSCNCASGYEWKEGRCVSSRPKCNIGDIFYSDNTCTNAANYNSSKTVLGVVVYVNSNGVGGQIMAPWLLDKNSNRSSSGVGMYWSTEYTDVLELPNMTSTTLAEADFDSCGNTDKIVAAGNASTYPAAWATRKYAPTTETAGKWCLPAAGILRNIQKNWSAIGTAVNKVGGASNLNNRWVWSSSEFSNYRAWNAGLVNSTMDYTYKYGSNECVVPVLAF